MVNVLKPVQGDELPPSDMREQRVGATEQLFFAKFIVRE